MTLMRFLNGYINGICHSVLTPKNTRERYYSLEKLKCNSSNYLPQQCSGTKAFRDILHKKLNSKCHTDQVIMKTSKGITVIKRIWNFLPRKWLVTIYKAIIRPHLDYGDILYDQPLTLRFFKKLDLFNIKQLLQSLVQFKIPPKKI